MKLKTIPEVTSSTLIIIKGQLLESNNIVS